jgi:hypothetical protein
VSWVSRGEDRWEWLADDDLHLLARAGERMVELHGQTVHEYRLGPSGLFPLEPLGGTEYVGTSYVTTPFAGADEAWGWLTTDGLE